MIEKITQPHTYKKKNYKTNQSAKIFVMYLKLIQIVNIIRDINVYVIAWTSNYCTTIDLFMPMQRQRLTACNHAHAHAHARA